ncbi:MAG: preprotein translocase subunit SecD [Euryarchaeota archaeon]|nr:preprotein translocase subunit SecD [Euryarchaeota archaeon]
MASTESKEAKSMNLHKDFRIIVFILAMLIALLAIHPGYSPEDGFTSHLQYGLDLDGGTYLKLQLDGVIAGIDADPVQIIKNEFSDAFGAVEIVDHSDTEITFRTAEPPVEDAISAVGYGDGRIRGNEVAIAINKPYVIRTYLSKRLTCEVMYLGGDMYEIRSMVNDDELSDLLAGVGGSIKKDIQGNLEFKEEVTKDTQDMTKNVLNEKLNIWGLKEIPITPVGSNVLMVDLAGIDLSTARDLVTTPGKFEIRVRTTNNTSEHVLWGDCITAVDIPKMQEGSWGVGFTLNSKGAREFGVAAVKYGAADDPDAHELIMLLDDDEVYSAPLNPRLASDLNGLYELYGVDGDWPSRGLVANTGSGDDGEREARQLQVHLSAGALPVQVTVVSSGQVPASLGSQFKEQSLIAGLFALLTVALVIFLRYRQKNILIPMIATSVSEVFMILGFATLIGWQLNLPAIAGIIAVIGTGIDHLVIITDEVLYEGKIPSIKVYLARIGKAFAIIFAAAATTIVAMSPLLWVGFGALKGFAITTIVGVLIGVLIARPAYGRVIRDMLE